MAPPKNMDAMKANQRKKKAFESRTFDMRSRFAIWGLISGLGGSHFGRRIDLASDGFHAGILGGAD